MAPDGEAAVLGGYPQGPPVPVHDPATGEHEQFYESEVVGGFTIRADGALLLFMARGAVAVLRDGAPAISTTMARREASS